MLWKAVAAASVASLISASTAQAGFLDFIFGKRQLTPVAALAEPHPSVVIRKPRVAKARAPKVIYVDPKETLARTIDPVAHPDWYLFDPTLRKGDVLVLTDRVLVFAGGKIGAPKSYAALDASRLLSKKERLQIAVMTGKSYAPPLLTAGVAPRQPQLLASATVTPPARPPLPLRRGT